MIKIMKILAFECSTATASVAVGDNGKIIGESSMEASRRHSEQLLPMADELLASLGLTLADIGALACSVGPGSFTGVRIGAATVKGLAFGSSRPCVGTSSLTSLAYCHSNSEDGTIICPVIGCRRGNVYNALYRVCGGEITRLCDDRMISCTELAEELISRGEQVIICGDEVPAVTALCPDDIVYTKNSNPLPSASGVALLADKLLRERNASGTPCENEYTDLTLSPDYFRPCQAERERLGIEG